MIILTHLSVHSAKNLQKFDGSVMSCDVSLPKPCGWTGCISQRLPVTEQCVKPRSSIICLFQVTSTMLIFIKDEHLNAFLLTLRNVCDSESIEYRIIGGVAATYPDCVVFSFSIINLRKKNRNTASFKL